MPGVPGGSECDIACCPTDASSREQACPWSDRWGIVHINKKRSIKAEYGEGHDGQKDEAGNGVEA